MRYTLTILFTVISSLNAFSQNISLSVGSDIPYQNYIGIHLESKKLDISYRTGLLTPPYSDAILNIIQKLGTDDIYIELLDASFNFGWENSLGSYYKFGKHRNWYVGGEFRFDYLTASDTPMDLIELVTGESVNIISLMKNNSKVNMGLNMIAGGFRFGKYFNISSNKKHKIKIEISISKHIYTRSSLNFYGKSLDRINKELNRLLWEDVF